MRTVNRTKVNLRLPRGLHERAATVAVEQDISLNGLLVALVADKLGYDVNPTVVAHDEASPAGRTEPSSAGGTDPPEPTLRVQLLDTAIDALTQLRALDAAVPEAA